MAKAVDYGNWSRVIYQPVTICIIYYKRETCIGILIFTYLASYRLSTITVILNKIITHTSSRVSGAACCPKRRRILNVLLWSFLISESLPPSSSLSRDKLLVHYRLRLLSWNLVLTHFPLVLVTASIRSVSPRLTGRVQWLSWMTGWLTSWLAISCRWLDPSCLPHGIR